MKAHWRYLRYVLRHKWYVFVECCRLGIPWAGLTHDLSKLRPSEWFPYVAYFEGPMYSEAEVRQAARLGIYLPCRAEILERFNEAWLWHQRRSPHHWQFWLLYQDDDAPVVVEMPERYMKEMLADWIGAGRAQGKPDVKAWYEAHRTRMALHPSTRAWIDERLL